MWGVGDAQHPCKQEAWPAHQLFCFPGCHACWVGKASCVSAEVDPGPLLRYLCSAECIGHLVASQHPGRWVSREGRGGWTIPVTLSQNFSWGESALSCTSGGGWGWGVATHTGSGRGCFVSSARLGKEDVGQSGLCQSPTTSLTVLVCPGNEGKMDVIEI